MAPASWLAALALMGAATSPARAATHVVPDAYSTIQAAIDAAVSGDSVLVRPGTYVESLALAGKDLTLTGEGDATETVLTTGGTARILDVGAGVGPATLITRLCFKQGRADRGGAIRVVDASPVIRGCCFTSNRVHLPGGDSHGGAVFVTGAAAVVIEECELYDNHANVGFDGNSASGGAISALDGASLAVRGSFLEDNSAQGFEGGAGGAIYGAFASLSIEECTFRLNSGLDGSIGCHGTDLEVRGCVFTSNRGTYGASAIRWEGLAGGDCSITGSVFFDNLAVGDAPVVFVGASKTAGRFEGNTVVFNQTGSRAAVEIQIGELRHNIVARNDGLGVGCYPSVVECNDVWNNGGGNYDPECGDPTGTNGNVSLDPLFCDADARNLQLRSDSPCAPEASACSLIGALPVACGATGSSPPAVRRLTLEPVRPNPGRTLVQLRFELSAAMHIRLEILDPAGRRVTVLAEGMLEAGRHSRSWRGAALRPGVYLAVLHGTGVRETRRFVVIE